MLFRSLGIKELLPRIHVQVKYNSLTVTVVSYSYGYSYSHSYCLSYSYTVPPETIDPLLRLLRVNNPRLSLGNNASGRIFAAVKLLSGRKVAAVKLATVKPQ